MSCHEPEPYALFQNVIVMCLMSHTHELAVRQTESQILKQKTIFQELSIYLFIHKKEFSVKKKTKFYSRQRSISNQKISYII